MNVIIGGKLPICPELDTTPKRRLWIVSQSCWHPLPLERPSMQEVIRVLEQDSHSKRALARYTPAFKTQTTGRLLVISMDLGTTFSGVSYCILEPDSDKPPIVENVKRCDLSYLAFLSIKVSNVNARFPGNDAGSAKVPTILIYDNDGNVRAAGAEALLPNVIDDMKEERWTKIEW